MRQSHPAAQAHQRPPGRSAGQRISWYIVVLTTVALPLFVSPTGKDVFRFPKHLMFISAGIVLAATATAEAAASRRRLIPQEWPQSVLVIVGGVLLWTGIGTVLSPNINIGVTPLLTTACAAMLFADTFNTVANRSIATVMIPLTPAVINAILAVLQRTGIWSPFRIDVPYPVVLRTTGLLGNPNDVGMFLVAPTLAAAALAVASRAHRLLATIAAVLLTVGLLATETLGAIVAVSAGLVALLLLISRRLALAGVLAILIAGTTVITSSPSRRSETQTKLVAAANGDWDPFLSGRVPAFLAAWRMFRANPIMGVGPGGFAFQYFDVKISVEKDHPTLRERHVINFGEVHSEHLQILAEGGLPAYLLFLSALVIIGSVSRLKIRPSTTTRTRFARTLGFPLAIALFVLAIAAFPLRLAAPTQSILFLCAMTISWGNNRESS